MVTAYDDPQEFPEIHETREACIANNETFSGSPCDDPSKRGVVCPVEIVVHIDKPIPCGQSLRDYFNYHFSDKEKDQKLARIDQFIRERRREQGKGRSKPRRR